MGCKRSKPTAHYQITVEGELDSGWAESFGGLTIGLEYLGDHSVSTLTGPVTDQAALRGMLCKMWDLNLTLIRVRRIEVPAIDQGGTPDG